MAPVGQMVMQATQRPQPSSTGPSTGSGKFYEQFTEEKNDPASRLRISECLPVQPSPVFLLSGAQEQRRVYKRSKIQRHTVLLNSFQVF